VICLPGSATTQSALLYLGDLGYEAITCEAEGLAAACPKSSLVLTTPDVLRLCGRPASLAGGLVIALADAGFPGDDLVAAKTADSILYYPLSRAEIYEIGQMTGASQPLHKEAKPPERDALPDFSGARILVADDSAVNREVAQAALARFGVEAILVENGKGAVEALRAGTYDLILMDGSMPDIDGFEATRMIRDLERAEARAHVPIIALTAHVVGAGADAWLEAGMDDILHKPYTLARLADCLARHLEHFPAKAEPAREQKMRQDEELGATADITLAATAPGTEHPPQPSQVEVTPSPNDASACLLDPEALAGLREMSGGATHLVERVARLYRDHAPMRIAELRDAIERSQFKGAASAAHALKSMSLNIGARAVAEAAAKIEHDANTSHALLTDQVVEELNSLAEQTCALLLREPA
jgi:two-component system sensor histidine kinase BarA